MHPRDGSGVDVLHADGDEGTRSVTATRLERADDRFSVRSVDTADAALDVLRRRDVDCVVSGYALPDRDGLRLFDALRDDDPDLPFILFADPGEAVAGDAIAAGVTAYLRKGDEGQYRRLANRIDHAVERYRSKRALEESQRRLSTLVSNLPGLVYRAELEEPWRMTFVGGRAEEVTGHPAAAFERGEVTFGDDLIVPEDAPEVRDAVAESVEDTTSFEISYRIHTREGALRHVYEQGEPVVEDGDPVALEGFIMDVTDQRERERELERQNQRLDEFVSVVSHDLRNPLSVASGHVELALEGATGDVEDSLRHADRALDRMERLVDDLLVLARDGAEAGERTSVSLADAARRCWQTVETSDAGLRVEGDTVVRADESRLHQLLENLFKNAVEHGTGSVQPESDDVVEHSPTGSQPESDDAAAASVTVTVGALPGGFYVEDDGPGIPADDRERVFDHGYSTDDEGTGFGLTIVARIAEAHGWSVAATEGATGGARFEVTGIDG